MFWTLFPAIIGLIEGMKTFFGDDENFLINEGMDIFFDTTYWARLTCWYDMFVKGNHIHKASQIEE